MRMLHFIDTYMKKYISENSRAPPMRHHGFEIARRVYDTCKICNCFTLSRYADVLMYRDIIFSKIELPMLK